MDTRTKLPINCIDYSPGYGTIGRTWRSSYMSLRNSILMEINDPPCHWSLRVSEGKICSFVTDLAELLKDPLITKILDDVDGSRVVEADKSLVLYIPGDEETQTLLRLIF